MNECNNPIIIYLIPYFREVLDNFRCCIRPDKTQKDVILAVDSAKNGLIIYVTIPIAIAMDQ